MELVPLIRKSVCRFLSGGEPLICRKVQALWDFNEFLVVWHVLYNSLSEQEGVRAVMIKTKSGPLVFAIVVALEI